jgi:FkbM family methyltransferase
MKQIVGFITYRNESYSQEGEDLIIDRFFHNQTKGFYIDIGAHHPKRFSNTYLLYKKGWNGINIDPMPGIMKTFKKIRPKDINLEIGISKTESKLKYYIFNDNALNTFSENEANLKSKINPSQYHIKDTLYINTYPLNKIFDMYIDVSIKIDLMSIDVEGLDLDVLISNDWLKYRPKLILVEELRTNIKMLYINSDINIFLESKDYSLHFRTYNTSFYIDSTTN